MQYLNGIVMDNPIISIPREFVSETESFDASVPISSILERIDKLGAVVITEGGKYLGIIDNRALYRAGIGAASGKALAVKFSVKTPAITDNTTIEETVLAFYKSRTKALPYFSDGKISGIIKRFTILKALLSLGMLGESKVLDAMTSPVLAIDASASLAQAKAVMRDKKVSRLVVLKDGKLYGIITNHDIVYGHAKGGERLPERKSAYHAKDDAVVGSICNTNLVAADCSKVLADAAREMIENNVSSVIAIKSGKPIGIITVFDIFGDVLSRRNAAEDNIFISGVDEKTKEYEQEIRDELAGFMAKAERMKKVKPASIIVNIKQSGKRYIMHARLSLEGRGMINAHAEDYMLSKCLGELIYALSTELKRAKEKNITLSREKEFRRGVDEVKVDEL